MIRRLFAAGVFAAVLVGAGSAAAWAAPNPPPSTTTTVPDHGCPPPLRLPQPGGGCFNNGFGPDFTAGNCRTVPDPRSPGQGVLSGMFDGTRPDTAGLPPSGIYENYGAHPFAYYTWDLGCSPLLQHTEDWLKANGDTLAGNLELGAAQDLVAFGNGVHRLVTRPTWLDTFDGWELAAVSGFRDHVWTVFAPLSLVLLALTMLIKNRSDAAGAARKLCWAGFVLLTVSIAMAHPVDIGHSFDKAETQIATGLSSAVAGGRYDPNSVASIEEDEIYRAWLRGEVGSATGPTAVQYGPHLLNSTAMTWQEAAAPKVRHARIVQQKAAEWEASAAAIKLADPGVYSQLTGKETGRAVAGFTALVGAAVTVPFRLVADGLVIVGLILLRLAVVLLPVIGVVAFHERMAPIFLHMIGTVWQALRNALVFSAASAVFVLVTARLLDPAANLPGGEWVALLLLGLASYGAWRLTRPLRRMGDMTSMHPIEVALHTVQQGRSEGTRRARHAVDAAGHGWKHGGAVQAVAAGAVGAVAGGVGVKVVQAVGERHAARRLAEKQPALPQVDTPEVPRPAPTVASSMAARIPVPEAVPALEEAGPQPEASPRTIAQEPPAPGWPEPEVDVLGPTEAHPGVALDSEWIRRWRHAPLATEYPGAGNGNGNGRPVLPEAHAAPRKELEEVA